MEIAADRSHGRRADEPIGASTNTGAAAPTEKRCECDRRLAFRPSRGQHRPTLAAAAGLQDGRGFRGGFAMGILSWIVLGLIAGFIGSKLVNRTGSGVIMDIVLGVVGAIVGGYISSALGYGTVTGLNLYSIVVAVIGAVVVLLIYRAVVSRT
jgi:uncharacterized membrane protein YeaQ/YmgE (transglycosylase-associated protein family)